MNYYDPFLAAWQLGPNGQALAVTSLQATTTFNGPTRNIAASSIAPPKIMPWMYAIDCKLNSAVATYVHAPSRPRPPDSALVNYCEASALDF